MAETTYHLAESQLDDGTIDFYTLLGEPQGADTETLRAQIQAIYGYASANRDHRNLNKRREFQALLELMPAARTALLEEPKRARYDAYLAAARAGNADTDFETFMNDLLGNTESLEDKTSLLGVQDKTQAEPRARVIKAPAPPTTSAPAAPSRAPAAAPVRSATPFFGAVAGFFMGLVIGLVLIHSLWPGILIGIILGAIGYVALNKKPGTPVGR